MNQVSQAKRPNIWILCFLCVAALSSGLYAGGNTTPPPGQTFFIPQCGHGTAVGNFFTTEINLLNLSSTTSSVTVQSFAPDGMPVDLLAFQISETTPNVPVAELERMVPGNGTARVLSLSQNAATDLTLGWCRVMTNGDVGVEVLFAIRDQQGNLTSTNVSPVQPGTDASFFGVFNPQVRTGMAILNPPENQEMIFIDLSLVDSNGDGVEGQRLELLPGQRAAFFVDDVFPDLPNFDGAVEATGEMPFVVTALRQEGIVLTTQQVFTGRNP